MPASDVVEPRLGFGEISIFLPGVRRNAATPGFAVKPVPGKIKPFFHNKMLHRVARGAWFMNR